MKQKPQDPDKSQLYPEPQVPGGMLSYQTGLLSVSLKSGQSVSGTIYLPVGNLWAPGSYLQIGVAGNCQLLRLYACAPKLDSRTEIGELGHACSTALGSFGGPKESLPHTKQTANS